MRFAEQRKVDLTTVSIAKIFTLVMKKSLSRYGVFKRACSMHHSHTAHQENGHFENLMGASNLNKNRNSLKISTRVPCNN
jgi:hypothetical protein